MDAATTSLANFTDSFHIVRLVPPHVMQSQWGPWSGEQQSRVEVFHSAKFEESPLNVRLWEERLRGA